MNDQQYSDREQFGLVSHRINPGFRKMILPIVLLALSLTVTLMGCGSKSAGTENFDPEGTVTAFWNAVQAGDYQAALKFVATTADTHLVQEMLNSNAYAESKDVLTKAIWPYTSIQPINQTINGDNATVTVGYSEPDYDQADRTNPGHLNPGDLGKLNTQDKISKLIEIFNNTPKKTGQDDWPLILENGQWRINTDPFYNLKPLSDVF